MARKIHVKGIVQGVGFRPFVYLLAEELGVHGWVLNAVDGVHIHAEAAVPTLDRFTQEIELQAPTAAFISSLTWVDVADEGVGGFSIKTSDATSAEATFVSPDLATCPQCLSELLKKDNRRYHYPFINCTNCGPRFTIIERLPYDRAATTMSSFTLCAQCAGEYSEVTNRRFHAQPNACFACGPYLELTAPETGEHLQGTTQATSDALIQRAAELLSKGKILAIKGLGGYHLACDATHEEAVQRLRERKHRPRKPLAVMCADLEAVTQRYAVSEAEADLLTSAAAPIVLLPGRTAASKTEADSLIRPLAPAVTCGVAEVGVMLPSTPLQHLLLRAVSTPLVMTSGNISEEPIIGDDLLAQEMLSAVADAFVSNNRHIVSRYDDSVVRVLATPATVADEGRSSTQASTSHTPSAPALQFVRRARGYAPRPLELVLAAPDDHVVLAVGPEQKNTFSLAHQHKAFVSQHLGDLEQASSFSNQLHTIELYKQLFNKEPTVLACDLHPDYLSTKWAEEQAESTGVPLLHVQHHHAHIAAVLAEHAYESSAIGLALDGTGYGLDGTIWGGEVLIASLLTAERSARLQPFALPGGAQAIKHPLRAAYALLLHHDATEHPAAARVRQRLGEDAVRIITHMIEKGINSPLTSSAGRLFDAVSALMGVCEEATYEGEPAILLEAAMQGEPEEQGSSVVYDEGTERVQGCRDILTQELIYSLLDLQQANVSVAARARFFHDRLMALFVEEAVHVREATGITTVALSGGCFNNRYVATQLPRLLADLDFEVLTHKDLPPNDGCVSYGQAAVACAQLAKNAPTSPITGGATLTPCV